MAPVFVLAGGDSNWKASLLSRGRWMKSAEVATLLWPDGSYAPEEEVEALRRYQQLFAVRTEDGWRYPDWQFDVASRRVPPELVAVLAMSPDPDGWEAVTWMMLPYQTHRGACTPLDLLKNHGPSAVLEEVWTRARALSGMW